QHAAPEDSLCEDFAGRHVADGVEVERHQPPKTVRGESVDNASPRVGRLPGIEVGSHAAAPSAEIEWFVLIAQIGQERPMVERLAGGGTDAGGRAVLLTLGMNLFIEPGLEP